MKQIQIQITPKLLKQLKEERKILNILCSIISQFEEYSSRYENIQTKNLFAYYKLNVNTSKSEFFSILEENIKSFEKKFIEFIKEYGEFNFPHNFSEEQALDYLLCLSKVIKENKIKTMISRIVSIIKSQNL